MAWLSPTRDSLELMLTFLDSLVIVRPMLALILVFLLPGFAWTLVLFRSRQINILERLALSLGLSIALVTLSILALNKLIGVSISGFNAILIIVTITIIPIVWYCLIRFTSRRRGNTS